jgi:hypothetical protein
MTKLPTNTPKAVITKATGNGATITPTVNKDSVARCGIPAPSPKGRNNIKLVLSPNAVKLLSENRLPAQAHTILYALDQLGGAAKQSDLIDYLDGSDSPLQTVQGATRIVTFYRKKLIEGGYVTIGG